MPRLDSNVVIMIANTTPQRTQTMAKMKKMLLIISAVIIGFPQY